MAARTAFLDSVFALLRHVRALTFDLPIEPSRLDRQHFVALVGSGTERVRPPRLPLAGARRKEIVGILETVLTSRPDLFALGT